MAKKVADKSEVVRNKKPRTVEQKRRDEAKKAANIKAAAERLARQQQRIKAQAAEKAAAAAAKHQHDNEDNYVADALKGTHGAILTKWLAGREATFERVNRFFNERPRLWANLPATPAQRQEAEAAMDAMQPHRKAA